jgi:hypothetical protein
MAMFLGVHDFGEPLTQEKMDDAWMRYSASCEKHGAKAHKVFYNLEQGRSWCITEAESADVVNMAHNEEKLPTKELYEVQKLSK